MAKKTHKINPTEDDFSHAVRDAFDGWTNRLEKGRGTQEGLPDLCILLPSGLEMAELKVGSLIDGVLWTEEVRPSQIAWHRELADHGGRSFFLVGVWCGDHWRAFAFDGISARYWETTGYKVGETCFEIDMNNLYYSLTEYVYRELES